MNPPSEDIKDKLVDASLGGDGGVADWAIYRNEEPDTPDKVITIYDTGGPPGSGYMNAALADLQYPTIQVRVRAQNNTDAYAKAEAIKDFLKALTGWFVGVSDETEYGRPFPTSEILPLGKDENSRSRFVVNFKVIRQDVS